MHKYHLQNGMAIISPLCWSLWHYSVVLLEIDWATTERNIMERKRIVHGYMNCTWIIVPLTHSLSGLHLLVSLCKWFRYMLYVYLCKDTKVKAVCVCKRVFIPIYKKSFMVFHLGAKQLMTILLLLTLSWECATLQGWVHSLGNNFKTKLLMVWKDRQTLRHNLDVNKYNC